MSGAAFGAPARIVLAVRHEALREEIHRALELAGHGVLPLGTAERPMPEGLGADVWIVDRDGGEALGLAAIDAGLAPDRVVWIGATPTDAAHGTASSARLELAKPFALGDLEETVDAVLDRTRAVARPPDDFVLRSVEPAMIRVLERAERLARLDVPVVIEGELGTGREALARSIHGWSRRAGEAMHVLDPGLVEDRRTDTDAIQARVDQARWGVLLVRDPADWSLPAQHALARALRPEQGRPRCLTIARDPLALHADRGDLAVELQYRLDAAALRLPPLRDRPGDQATLCRAAARRIARSLGRETPDVDPELIAALAREGFPGNRLGLESRLRAALIRSDRPEALLADDLASTGGAAQRGAAALESLDLKTLERETIVRALAHWKGNRTRASESLGISVRTLRNKIRDYGLR